MTDDFERAATPVVGTPCRDECPLAKKEVRRHWLDLLAPGGSVARLADIVDGLSTKLARMDRRVTVVMVVVGLLVSFAAGCMFAAVLKFATRVVPGIK